MVVSTGPARARVLAALRFGALVLACILTTHTLVFVARYGVGERLAAAMTAEGHDAYWPLFLLVVGGGAAAAAGNAGMSLLALRRRVPRRRRSADGRRLPAYSAEMQRLLPGMFGATTVGYAIQENLEHLAVHGHLPGAGILWGPEGTFALPGLVVVSILGASLGALVRWRVRVLVARIGRAAEERRPFRPAGSRPARRWVLDGLPGRARIGLVPSDAGRAPPRTLLPT